MSPENAKIFHAEDHPTVRDGVKMLVETLGDHHVVVIATNKDEALGILEKLGELEVDVAIVDGNYKRGDDSGKDGAAIVKRIKELHPNITTIGYSNNIVEGADISIQKGSEDSYRLADIITKLP